MSSTIGILVIGSLRWDKDARETWRRSRLRVQDEISVAAPIRYGRLSTAKARKDTYTMVFSSDLTEEQFGRAKVLPCVNDVSCLADLMSEATSLWSAEDTNAKPNALGSSFGCTVLLRNPDGNADNELITGWARQDHFRGMVREIEEGRLISDQGLLNIPWPRLASGEPLKLDLLLATANKPTVPYPSAQDVANAWKRALEERPACKPDAYFWENRKHRITTFQDDEIEMILNNHSGCSRLLRSIIVSLS